MSVWTDNAKWETLLGDERRAIALRQKARAAEAKADERAVAALDRAAERRQHRQFRAAWRARWARDKAAPLTKSIVVLTFAVIGAIMVSYAASTRSLALGICCVAYLLIVFAGSRVASARARRIPTEHFDKVREQLDRVQSTLTED